MITRLERLAWTEVDGTRPVVVIPVGACEQHGPHLPLGTDTLIAVALAERLCARVTGLVLGPPLAVTASGEHAGFAGTLSLGTPTTAAALVELVRSAGWAHGLVLVNAHGGNADALHAVVATARDEGRHLHVWWPRPAPDDDAHAGHTETSAMLAIHPELVHASQAAPGEERPLESIAGALRTRGVRAVSHNGVLGDPTHATAATGRRIIDGWTDDLVASTIAAIAVWAECPSGR